MERSASPMSGDVSECAMDTLPITDKANLARNLPKHLNNNNTKAGYIPVNQPHIHKTGLRGRKTFAFWTLVCLLFILAIGNLVLTFTILGVLRLGQGMESLEIVPEQSVIKLFGNVDLDRICKRDGRIEGFNGSPVEISILNGSFIASLIKNNRPYTKLKIDHNGTIFKGLDRFDVKDPQTGETIFNTESPIFDLPKEVQNLNVKIVRTNCVTSPMDKDLHLRSETKAHLQGTEGTHMEGKEIVWSADQDVFLKSENGSVVLSGKEGVFIDIRSIPIAAENHNHSAPGQTTGHYKVCVCMPQGKLFRVPVPKGYNSRISCAHVNISPINNPCI